MRGTFVLYQQMLRACISARARARESEDPGPPPPGLATRRHVCVHVVYLAGSELCEMGDGRDGRVHGGLLVLSAGSDNQPFTRIPGAQVCEKRRPPRRSGSPPRALIGVRDHRRKSRAREIYNELQLDVSCDPLARCFITALARTVPSSLFMNDESARVCSTRFHTPSCDR